MTADQYKAARESFGTQAQVAILLGVSREVIARRETGSGITTEAALAIQGLQLKTEINIGMRPADRIHERRVRQMLTQRWPRAICQIQWNSKEIQVGVSQNAPGPAWTPEEGKTFTDDTAKLSLEVLEAINAVLKG